jgi:hypothetical protein
MPEYRLFQISATLFWGWQSKIDIEEYYTIDKVIIKIQENLKQFFKDANLEDLVKEVDNMRLHCHEDIEHMFSKNVKPNEIFYLCDHCQ